MNTKKYYTQRLMLRPTNVEDAEFILELMNSPKFIKYIGDRQVKTVGSAEAYIRSRMIPQLEKRGFSNNTVIRLSDLKKIGTCGLYDRDGLEGVDLGFGFLPAYERMGYAYEASRKMLDVAKDEFDIKFVKAITLEENKSSIKLLKKLGFEFSEYIRLPDDPEELMLFETKL